MFSRLKNTAINNVWNWITPVDQRVFQTGLITFYSAIPAAKLLSFAEDKDLKLNIRSLTAAEPKKNFKIKIFYP